MNKFNKNILGLSCFLTATAPAVAIVACNNPTNDDATNLIKDLGIKNELKLKYSTTANKFYLALTKPDDTILDLGTGLRLGDLLLKSDGNVKENSKVFIEKNLGQKAGADGKFNKDELDKYKFINVDFNKQELGFKIKDKKVVADGNKTVQLVFQKFTSTGATDGPQILLPLTVDFKDQAIASLLKAGSDLAISDLFEDEVKNVFNLSGSAFPDNTVQNWAAKKVAAKSGVTVSASSTPADFTNNDNAASVLKVDSDLLDKWVNIDSAGNAITVPANQFKVSSKIKTNLLKLLEFLDINQNTLQFKVTNNNLTLIPSIENYEKAITSGSGEVKGRFTKDSYIQFQIWAGNIQLTNNIKIEVASIPVLTLSN